MRPFVLLTAVSLWLAPLWLAQGREPVPAAPAEEECTGDFGTSIDFLDTPADAAKKALKEQKLVFVLHVSGHFEDPRFT
jgi:hypothetical protein